MLTPIWILPIAVTELFKNVAVESLPSILSHHTFSDSRWVDEDVSGCRVGSTAYSVDGRSLCFKHCLAIFKDEIQGWYDKQRRTNMSVLYHPIPFGEGFINVGSFLFLKKTVCNLFLCAELLCYIKEIQGYMGL